MTATHQAVEQVVRNSYGRLIAYLASRSGDIPGAEDALSEAFQAALQTWPERGVPDKPEAWLLQTARRLMIDEARRNKVREKVMTHLIREMDVAEQAIEQETFPDERLKLLFTCAHPAIDPNVRTALLLQTVLGLDAAQIASAFLVAPATMSQRLVRAKTRIREAKVPFLVPEKDELGPRLDAVLEAIYTVYGQGWDAIPGTESATGNLTQEAITLARLMVRFLPDEPEAQGLLALMLFCEARQAARRDANGAYIPLSQQDTHLWSAVQIAEAETRLQAASRQKRPGRFQLEAAIQSAHALRARTGVIRWDVIVALYDGLIHFAPTVGAYLGRAAALAEWQGANAGLRQLDVLEAERVKAHQPYWAVRASLLQRAGRLDEARLAYERAAGLTEDLALRAFLLAKAE